VQRHKRVLPGGFKGVLDIELTKVNISLMETFPNNPPPESWYYGTRGQMKREPQPPNPPFHEADDFLEEHMDESLNKA